MPSMETFGFNEADRRRNEENGYQYVQVVAVPTPENNGQQEGQTFVAPEANTYPRYSPYNSESLERREQNDHSDLMMPYMFELMSVPDTMLSAYPLPTTNVATNEADPAYSPSLPWNQSNVDDSFNYLANGGFGEISNAIAGVSESEVAEMWSLLNEDDTTVNDTGSDTGLGAVGNWSQDPMEAMNQWAELGRK